MASACAHRSRHQHSIEGVRVVGLNTDKLVVRIQVGDDALWRGKPLYAAIVEEALHHHIVGAIVYRTSRSGGTSSPAEEHFARPSEPTIVSIIDREEKVQLFLPVVEELVNNGVIAVSDVEVIRHRTAPVA
jgi:PII-like signaling protein